jgi:NodT family efflux transporter outer membrane factor (OMF) lipoprotein
VNRNFGWVKIVSLCGMAGLFQLFLSCTAGPDYVRPPAPVPEAYREIQGWKIAEPKDQTLRGKWWEMFDDHRLNDLAEQIDISNQNIASAEAQFRQARALVQAARAGYFPTVTVGASFTRSLASSATGTATASPQSVSLYSLPVDASWELDLWGRIRRSVEASRAGAQASEADLESVRLSARVELVQDYFQMRALDAQKELLDRTVDALERSRELTQNRYLSGIASRGDVLQADTLLSTTRAQAIDLGVQRSQFEHAIGVLIGEPPSLFILPFSPLAAPPPAIPVGLPSELLERRPDIAGAERRMAAANAQIGVAVAGYYPTVTLGASAGFQSTDLSRWLNWPSRFWSFGPALSELVFSGGLIQARTEQARAGYEAAVANYRQIVLTAFQEVEDNLAALRILEQESAIQEEAVQAAEQSLEIAANQYKAGIVGYLNVIAAQTAVLSGRRASLDILSRRMTAGILLIKALGGGWNSTSLPDSSGFVSER